MLDETANGRAMEQSNCTTMVASISQRYPTSHPVTMMTGSLRTAGLLTPDALTVWMR